MKKFTTIFAIALLIFQQGAIAQRRNLSYDTKYPKGHTEREFVAYVYNPDPVARHETCRQLAGVRFSADVETVKRKNGYGWACYKILR